MGISHKKTDLKRWWKEFKDAGYNELELSRRTKIPSSTWQARIIACEGRLGVKRKPAVKARDLSLPDAELRRTFETFTDNQFNQSKAAREMGLSRSAFQMRLAEAESRLGLKEPKTA